MKFMRKFQENFGKLWENCRKLMRKFQDVYEETLRKL